MPRELADQPPSYAPFLRRATLYGAGLGVIVGLVDRGLRGDALSEVAAIERWRTFILVGAAVGLVLGAFLGWLARRIWKAMTNDE